MSRMATAPCHALVGKPAGRGAAAAEIGGLGVVDVAELTLVQQLTNQRILRIEAAWYAEQELHAGLLHGGLGFERMLQAVCKRLFAQDVLAGLGGGDGHGRVAVVPGTDVHSVDVLVRQQFFDGSVSVRDPEALGKSLRTLQIEVGDGDDLRLVARRVRGHVGIRGDVAGADDADTDFFHNNDLSFPRCNSASLCAAESARRTHGLKVVSSK